MAAPAYREVSGVGEAKRWVIPASATGCSCPEGAFLFYSPLLHLPKATQAIKPRKSRARAPGTSATGSHGHSVAVFTTSPWLALFVSFSLSEIEFLYKRSTAEPHP